MVAQGVLPFRYESERNNNGRTSLAGLMAWADLAEAIGFARAFRSRLSGIVRRRRSGWSEADVVQALVFLKLAGGESVEDLRWLAKDRGFCRVMGKAMALGLGRKQRLRIEKEVLKGRRSVLPSPSAMFRFLNGFYDEEEMSKRDVGKSWIPAKSAGLKALELVNRDLLTEVQRRSPSDVATLDMDATLVETNKKQALHCYKGFQVNFKRTVMFVCFPYSFRDRRAEDRQCR